MTLVLINSMQCNVTTKNSTSLLLVAAIEKFTVTLSVMIYDKLTSEVVLIAVTMVTTEF